MKTLYQIKTPYSTGGLFYWADSPEEALEMACQQGMDREIEATVDKVWANNTNIEYRGYVINEN